MKFLKRIFGDLNKKALGQAQGLVLKINELEDQVSKLKEQEIKDRISDLKKEVQEPNGPKSLDEILPEVFALAREASKRALKMRHFDVQLVGGIVLHEGNIAEMKTGEGKTLVATLPAVLNALLGKGVHIVTVNDYLARRDCGWMGPLYHTLGLSCGVIIHDAAFIFDPDFSDENAYDENLKHLKPCERREAYLADIIYGVNNDFGFDYLRDNMVADENQMVQRELNFAIVDEVDSILIDEARTPLIISAPAEESTEKYYQFASLVTNLHPDADYKIDEKMRAATLTEEGIAKVERLLGVQNVYEEKGIETVRHLEQSLKAQALFRRDKDYVVKDGEVIIVDEFTGRLMTGRRYSEGLHKAIEAKEGVEIQKESLTLATVSFQNYFRLYNKLAGMTGTAMTEAEEFAKIYKLDCYEIPTNQLAVRKDHNDLIYKTEEGKFKAVADEIEECHKKGQPVLVGTVSIEKNELLGDLLRRRGIKHELLNAKNHLREAEIIAQAGSLGAVTVATNMAGRGVDIILGGHPADAKESQKVKEFGGLHVIGTERHESRRIDNQLRGRSGRQGDPGSTRFYVCLEDDLMRIFGSERVKALMDRLGFPEDQPIEHGMISKSLESAQRKVEGYNFDLRKHLVEYDDVMNKHREYIYKKRREILKHANLREEILDLIKGEVEKIVNSHFVTGAEEEIDQIINRVAGILPLSDSAKGEIKKLSNTPQGIIQVANDFVNQSYKAKEKEAGEAMRMLERAVYLRIIDTLWIEHLDSMEHLREGISLRGYAQKDPLIEYKHEAYSLFQDLLATIETDVCNLIFKVGIAREERKPVEVASHQEKPQQEKVAPPKQVWSQEPAPKNLEGETQQGYQQGEKETQPQNLSTEPPMASNKKIGRNDPCFCGSGKKYKKCHGK